MKWVEREEQKTIGWKLYADKALIQSERQRGIVKVITAHYERSKEAWEDRHGPGSHPDFSTYASSWLHANGERLLADEPKIRRSLEVAYPPTKELGVRPGMSYWGL
jgi:hypothetical protein